MITPSTVHFFQINRTCYTLTLTSQLSQEVARSIFRAVKFTPLKIAYFVRYTIEKEIHAHTTSYHVLKLPWVK